MRQGIEDRRKYRRHKLENSVTISSHGIFQISDISQGGFSFRCPPYTSIPKSLDTDILTPFSQLYDFFAERVWFSIAQNNPQGNLLMVVGARFGKLTKEKKALLSKIIKDISENPDFG